MPLLLLESKNKDAGGSDTDYTISFNRPVKNVISMNLVDYMVPNTVYPIITGLNDVLDFTYSGAKTATLSSQNYSGVQLAAELQAKIIAAGGTTVVVTYDPQTNKLSFQETGGTAFTIATQTSTPKILDAIGVAEGQTATSATFVATNQVDLSFPAYMYVTLEFNGRQSDTVFNGVESFTFILLRKDSKFLSFNDNSNIFEHRVKNPNIDFDSVRVRWFTPDKTANDTGLWDFGKVSNRILLRLNRGADA